ncbi:DUF3307 domain-containing protein [Microvirga tunisiensis]|uniref:DUF3307 domain-containing protein n=1 Tax=Pannonibacter tanglangensis TaxID=2750084 RepID=A0A7X5F6Y8_9HYPH|nr:DUF3307 domain-containing protein [Pannonibacter sp. XCT-53]NBN79945.1 DUF3307 domain-containing protein [Pannonibacter sp. XCT-53]
MQIPDQIDTGWLGLVVLAFLAKHFIADFLFQTHWMAMGKEGRDHWILPLAAHAGIHAALTALLASAIAPSCLWLAAVDFVVHFAIDRSKAALVRVTGATPQRAGFWWLLGLDQTLHHLTHFAFILVMAGASTA